MAKVQEFEVDEPQIRQVSVSPKNNLATVVVRSIHSDEDVDHVLFLIELSSGRILAKYGESDVTSAVFSQDENHIIAGIDTKDGIINILSANQNLSVINSI